jgi:heme O synthase-like polyprenyltransferase
MESSPGPETFGHGVISGVRTPKFDSTAQAAWLWGLMCLVGAVGAWHLRHDSTTTVTIPVVMVLVGLCFVMYALYGWSGAIVPSCVFVGIAAQVWLSRTTEPKEMKAEKRLFAFSILYLFGVFGALVADRMLFA